MTTSYHIWGDIIDNAAVYGLYEAVRASKYPMAVDTAACNDDVTDTVKRLAKAPIGSGHNNYLSGIVVQFCLTCTVKMWTEFERYHFAQIVSSQSTMHRITKFDLDEAYIDFVDERIIEIMKQKVAAYNADPTPEKYLEVLYSNPCGMKLTARISTNYLQLKTMYAQRKNHRLPEWREFCAWIRQLPHSELITGEVQNNDG